MKTQIRPLILAVLLAPGASFAAGDASPSKPADPVLERAADATSRSDWKGAQAILKDGLASNPSNAEYHNMYAYNLRKGPSPDMSLVFKHYNEALRIEPKHRGANEYLGEAYLMVNNLPKAKEQLATLDKLCFLPCREYTELKASIADYEAKRK
jgi:cytochrome c-type biogenesis protein CcmH/NrfG